METWPFVDPTCSKVDCQKALKQLLTHVLAHLWMTFISFLAINLLKPRKKRI
jgi:hypothetical protein